MARHAIPASHPRAASLLVRQRLVDGFDAGLVAREGLLAHGRGEAFDYMLGERTGRAARRACRAAAAALLLASHPVVSVNGNAAALCAAELVGIGRAAGAPIEVNLFYGGRGRAGAVARTLRRHGASGVLGTERASRSRLAGTDSDRGWADRRGILAADAVLVPLEDGDRTAALRDAGKTVIALDLNPLSRTARTASITIVDNVVRSAGLLAREIEGMSRMGRGRLLGILSRFDNAANLAESVAQMRENLGRAAHA
ncbi:MAG: phosphopantothenate/pantothenate synthetase [Nitrosopumilus sp.]|nr:phosphopantothenate/pantothenate synthetase [Nitrosopumilus sp.]CAI9831068.1 4-phosphopantoate--beta-alanine ligase [Nitrosopumilaceae archaeon]MDA7941161.1 phosphopantothenate/pantothenate synthetase [Nitrosopumilus sp.]MDA7942441.1 phosphopantothenate/pantothenate synthetase [Nitrosopumilus sp.]MDA7944839.1 phosphopantothenate/pantothenate synthetase [Nitrosopumilus sp.]